MVEGPRSASSGKRPKGPGWAVVPEPTVPETKGPPPCALALDPRRLVRDPGNNTRGSAAEIQGAGTTIDGPSTTPRRQNARRNHRPYGYEAALPVPKRYMGSRPSFKGRGTELKVTVPEFDGFGIEASSKFALNKKRKMKGRANGGLVTGR